MALGPFFLTPHSLPLHLHYLLLANQPGLIPLPSQGAKHILEARKRQDDLALLGLERRRLPEVEAVAVAVECELGVRARRADFEAEPGDAGWAC
jgi:hypothetical protein